MKKRKKSKAGLKTFPASIALIAGFVLLSAAGLLAVSSAKKDGRIILAINSGACHCVKNRCLNMQKDVKELLSEKGFSSRVAMRTIDTVKGAAAAKEMEKYSIPTVPYLILVNAGGEVKYKANAFEFNRDALSESIKTVLQEAKND
ncbi:MAG TPA: hypothetical protein P5511_06320 [Candidatus Goldiibacteriota bacterium]|nr:hypothetical protein [Candidatus Goldiibacteriota bacterium]